jgi:hypothetical protein
MHENTFSKKIIWKDLLGNSTCRCEYNVNTLNKIEREDLNWFYLAQIHHALL